MKGLFYKVWFLSGDEFRSLALDMVERFKEDIGEVGDVEQFREYVEEQFELFLETEGIDGIVVSKRHRIIDISEPDEFSFEIIEELGGEEAVAEMLEIK